MRRWAVVFMIGLSGCVADPPSVPAPSYRDDSAPIGSKAVFDPARFAGSWHVVAQIGDAPGCAPAQILYAIEGDQVTELPSCPTARFAPKEGRLLPLGRMQFDEGQRWVLWADEGYRTAVLGAPDGRFAWILNRNAQIPADRLRAAREILDFSGYDLGQLLENRL